MKNLCRALCAFALTAGVMAGACAQADFPSGSKTIRILVGFSAGGATDSVARLYGQKMSEILKTPVIIENKPGANQIFAIRALTSAPADGYTLYLGTGSSLAQGPGLRNDLPYDPLHFSLVGLAASTPGVMVVNAELPVRSVSELLAYTAAHPDRVNYGSAGMGTASHLQTELLMRVTGAKWTHIPFKSDGDVVREVAEGRIQVSLSTIQQAMPLIQAGKLKPLALISSRPLKYLPGVPTLAETGVKGLAGLEPYTFFGLVGPAGMPAAIVARLNAAMNQVPAMPDVAARMSESLYAEPATTTPASFRTFLVKEIAKWKPLAGAVKLSE